MQYARRRFSACDVLIGSNRGIHSFAYSPHHLHVSEGHRLFNEFHIVRLKSPYGCNGPLLTPGTVRIQSQLKPVANCISDRRNPLSFRLHGFG